MRIQHLARKFQPALLRERFETSLWVIPVIAVLSAIGLTEIFLRVDQHIAQSRQDWFLFGGGVESAREFLSTIASSLLTFTGLVFSITILVLQLASSQFSPRVLRSFLEDRFTRFSMGLFVGSFTYAMALLPELRVGSNEEPEFVPALSIFVAFVLVLLCVGVFVHYIHHMAHSIRAVHVIQRVADETRHNLERMYPEQAREPAAPVPLPSATPDQEFPHDRPPGVVIAIQEEALLALACERDVLIALVPYVGNFLPRGAPLFKVWGKGPVTLDDLREHVVVGVERTPHQDPAFGFRQLVDVAERALSPGVNDPTTAVQALDQLHDLLRSLSTRAIPAASRIDDSAGSGSSSRVRTGTPSCGWRWTRFVNTAKGPSRSRDGFAPCSRIYARWPRQLARRSSRSSSRCWRLGERAAEGAASQHPGAGAGAGGIARCQSSSGPGEWTCLGRLSRAPWCRPDASSFPGSTRPLRTAVPAPTGHASPLR